MKQFMIEFTVVGISHFPLDMLRYDACYPCDQEGVGAIADSMDPRVRLDRVISKAKDLASERARGESQDHPDVMREARKKALFRVRVCHVGPKGWFPTAARWLSFDWQVDSTSFLRREVT